MARRRLIPEEKAFVLTKLALNDGNVKKTARETGISRAALTNWKNGRDMPPEATELAATYKENLADLFEEKVYRLVGHMTDEKMEAASMGELMTAATKAVDKMLLLRGQPNRITEDVTQQEYVDRVCELLDRARARAIAATPRQKLFLDLEHKEAFFGGSAGPGKSSALLLAALEYVHIPGYSALLLRRTFPDLNKPGALMDRLHDWLQPTAATWNEQTKTWRFPSGATISFGHLETENDKYKYQGAEFQYVAFDEVSQFQESQYLYLFSRLRRLTTSDIPIRMRAASNPGGVGANWVRARFIPPDFTPGQSREFRVFEVDDIDPDGFPVRRAFVPARMEDNPYLDQAEYRQSLNELDAVTREQLLAGDWSIQERGNIYPMWNELDHVITWSQFEKVYGQSSIPNTWQLGIGHDVGFTEGHPYVVSFVATSPENSKLPGRKFLFRELCGYEATAREIGQRIKDVMTVGEKDRVRTWLMSHEAASERAEYSRVHGLHFSSWKPDKNGGISQVRDYLELQDLESPNPFKPTRRGQPWLYFVVPDDQLVNPTEERGLARHRAEMPVYRYGTLRSGDEKHVVAPHPLFNDAMDALRGLASEDFAPMLRLSPVEVAVRNLKSKGTLLTDAVLAQIDDGAQSVAVLSHMQNLQRELQQAESDYGPIFNPRLRSGDQ